MEKISARQLALLVMLFIEGTTFTIIPSRIAAEAKQDAWIVAIIGTGVALLIAWLYGSIGNHFEGKSLIEAIQSTFGQWLGAIIALPIIFYTLMLSSLVFANISNFVDARMLTNTPLEVTEMLFILLIITGARLGIENIARTTEIMFPIFVILVLIFVSGVLPDVQTDNLLPIFESGLEPILRATRVIISFPFAEIFLFLMIFPFVTGKQKIRKGFIAGTLLGGNLLFVGTIVSLLVLGSFETAHHIYPSFAVSKKIDIGNFIQRIEMVTVFAWILSSFVKLSICFYSLLLILQQLMKLKEKNFLTFPLGMLLIPVANWISPNSAVNISVTSKQMGNFSIIMLLFVLVIGLISWIKLKISRRKMAS